MGNVIKESQMNTTLQAMPRTRLRIKARRKVRSCLMCGRKFKSEGPHNRRCARCNYLLEHAREGTYYQPTVYSLESGRAINPLDVD